MYSETNTFLPPITLYSRFACFVTHKMSLSKRVEETRKYIFTRFA